MKIPTWFRFHLSTAVVLMVSASLLIALNVRKSSRAPDCYGWPMTCVSHDDINATLVSSGYEFDFKNMIIDVVTYAVLLVVLALVLEKRIAVKKRVRPDGSLSDEENNDS